MATDTLATTPDVIKARILVVDDNPGTAATLARALARLSPDLDIISATDGESALKQTKDTPIDLVITDMMMPGMNGLELIESLRRHAFGNPLHSILITAYDVPGLRESARRIKIDDVFIKPIPPEQICKIVRRALEHAQPRTALPRHDAGASPKFKLLAADDNPSNLSLLLRYLQQEEYQIYTASNGAETLEKLRAEPPDLLLLDVNMPEVDGFQVLEQMRADPALEHIPVIIITAARLDPVDMQYALNTGADDYITKPFDRRELLARIRTRLRVKEAEDAIRRSNRELNLLPEIARELSVPRPVAELGNIILRRTVETLGAFCGRIILFEGQETIQHAYQVVASDKNNLASEQLDLQALRKYFIENRQGFIIEDTSKDPRWPMNGAPSAMVIAPIWGRADLLGFLALAHEQPRYFKPEHVFLLQALGGQAAIAIENARLFTSKPEIQHQPSTPAIAAAPQPHLAYDALTLLIAHAKEKRAPQKGEIQWSQSQRFSVSVSYDPARGRYNLELQDLNFVQPTRAAHSERSTSPVL